MKIDPKNDSYGLKAPSDEFWGSDEVVYASRADVEKKTFVMEERSMEKRLEENRLEKNVSMKNASFKKGFPGKNSHGFRSWDIWFSFLFLQLRNKSLLLDQAKIHKTNFICKGKKKLRKNFILMNMEKNIDRFP